MSRQLRSGAVVLAVAGALDCGGMGVNIAVEGKQILQKPAFCSIATPL